MLLSVIWHDLLHAWSPSGIFRTFERRHTSGNSGKLTKKARHVKAINHRWANFRLRLNDKGKKVCTESMCNISDVRTMFIFAEARLWMGACKSLLVFAVLWFCLRFRFHISRYTYAQWKGKLNIHLRHARPFICISSVCMLTSTMKRYL